MSVEKPLHGFSLQISVFKHRISRAIKRPAEFFAVQIDFYAEVFVKKEKYELRFCFRVRTIRLWRE